MWRWLWCGTVLMGWGAEAGEAPGKAATAPLRIENDHLVVEVSGQLLSLEAKPGGLRVIPRVAFGLYIESVSAAPVNDPVWGTGKQLTLAHADGWFTHLRLFAGQSFVHIHTVAGNRSSE
ncbi:hypothetical protein JW905_08675, partial [bacterium]|nr:hypothetical protein [candidate division CSSED10-310 bacterium]